MARKHILVVDSDPVRRRNIARALRDASYVVTLAPNRQKAATRIASNPPDVVLANLQKETFSTLEALIYVKNTFPDLPLLLVATPVVPETAQQSGTTAEGVMEKPRTLDDFLDRIGAMLAS